MPDFFSFLPTPQKNEAEARLARVYAVTGCRTQKELAAFLDIKQSTVADAKRRGSIPPEWLVKLVVLKSVHPNWIMTGKGPHLLLPVDAKERQSRNPCT